MNCFIKRVRPFPGGVQLTCDCGHPTDITVEVGPGVLGTVELAYTCDACLGVHWFYVRVTERNATGLWQGTPGDRRDPHPVARRLTLPATICRKPAREASRSQ